MIPDVLFYVNPKIIIMKIFYYLLISILLFTGCKKPENNEITVIGHLKDTDTKEITLTSDNLSYKSPVDSDGNFILKFVYDQPRVYQLTFSDKLYLFLIPGDSLIIDKNGDEYSFSGGQSAILSQYYLEWENNYWNNDSFDEKEFYSLEPEEFTKTAYAYLDTSQILLNELVSKIKNISPEFVRLEKERLKYDMFLFIQAYAYQMHKYHTGKDPAINESFFDFMKEVNLNDSSLIQLEYYKAFLIEYIYYTSEWEFKNNAQIVKNKYALTNNMLNNISRELKYQSIRDYVSHNLILDQTKLLQVNDKNLATFKKLCSRADFVNEVENNYRQLEILMPGNSAPDFKIYDVNNKEYKLSDFTGKYLLIDVWGAFCGPCKKEAPFLNQIEHDYMDKNIVFIGVCFENNSEIWQKRIKEFNLKGLQFRAKGSWNSQFRKDYQIPWVPTYILINKEGKFIDARAPKPSENLRELLDNTCI